MSEQAPAAKPRISVVVCTYDRYDVLPGAIETLLKQDVEPSFYEIIVVDNSPDQEGAAEFGKRYAGEPLITYDLEPVPGLSNARNKGAEMARGEIVAFVDDDALIDPDWARLIVKAYDDYKGRAGIVGGRVIPHWVSERPSWVNDYMLIYLSIVDWGGERRQLEEDKWVAGCNISFHRETLLKVGGFSRSLGRSGASLALLSNEETAVAEKIHELGLITVFEPAALVEHVIDPERLTRGWFRRRMAWQAVSDFIKDAAKTGKYAPDAMQHLKWALEEGNPPAPVGFFTATDDSDQFEKDMRLCYDIVVAILSGGVELTAQELGADETADETGEESGKVTEEDDE